MTKSLAIALREYSAAVKTKAFVISVVLLPVMLFGTFAVQRFTTRLGDGKELSYVFLDRGGDQPVFDALVTAVENRNRAGFGSAWRVRCEAGGSAAEDLRYKLSDQIRKGDLAGYIEVSDSQILYHSNSATDTEFRDFAARSINHTLRNQRLAQAGLSVAKIEPLLVPLQVTDAGLSRVDSKTGQVISEPAPNGVTAILVPFALVMLMFMVVLIGAIPMMQGVIEEKQQRIAEVLLASVRPFELMAGKLIGMTAISFTLFGIYGIGGVWMARHSNYQIGAYVTPSLLCWFLLFQILAVLMFGSMYIAIGASCSDMKEAQSLLLPINLLIILPLMLAANVIQHPGGSLARWASFFPTAAPMLTIARIAALPTLPLWEKLGPAAITVLATLLFVWAAGRIFRVGLMAGQSSLLKMMGWIVRG
jgi:ABC-2 type transport system permease protein